MLNRHPSLQTVDLDSTLSCVDWKHWGTGRQIEQHPWLEIHVSTCLAEQWKSLFVSPEITDRDFQTQLLIFTLWIRQFGLISDAPLVYVHLCIYRSGLVCTVWKVFRLRGENSEMQIPPESHCCILMFHWIWALKALQYHWVFCTYSLNGLCKILNCELNFPCMLVFFPFPFETRYWRWSPYSGKWLF